jgi:hypothetical protein
MTTPSASHRVNPLKTSPPGRGLGGENLKAFSTPIIHECAGKTTPNNSVYDHGRVIGYIRGDVLHRKMQGSRHILKSPPSIAIGVEALRQAIRCGAETVFIQDMESGLEYRCGIWDFNSSKAISIDRGYGEQQALPLEYFIITDPKHPEVQLSLLDGEV